MTQPGRGKPSSWSKVWLTWPFFFFKNNLFHWGPSGKGWITGGQWDPSPQQARSGKLYNLWKQHTFWQPCSSPSQSGEDRVCGKGSLKFVQTDYRNHCPDTKAGTWSTRLLPLASAVLFCCVQNTSPSSLHHEKQTQPNFRFQHTSESKGTTCLRDYKRHRVPSSCPPFPTWPTHLPPGYWCCSLSSQVSGIWNRTEFTPGWSRRGASAALACLVRQEPTKTE